MGPRDLLRPLPGLPLRADGADGRPLLPGSVRRCHLPVSRAGVRRLVEIALRRVDSGLARRRHPGVRKAIPLGESRRRHGRRPARIHALDGLPPALSRRRDRVLRDHARSHDAGLPARPRQSALLEVPRRDDVDLEDGPRHERDLGHPVRLPRHACGLEPVRRAHRGGRTRPRCQPGADVPRGDATARLARRLRLFPVRLHPHLERLRPHRSADERIRYRDAPGADLRPDVQPGDPTRSLRARGCDDARLARCDRFDAHRGHDSASLPRSASATSRGGARTRRGDPGRRLGSSSA